MQCFGCVTHALKHSNMVSKSLKCTYFTSNIDFYRSVLFRIIQLIRIRAASSKNRAILAHHINKNYFWTAKYFFWTVLLKRRPLVGLRTNKSMWVRLSDNRPSYSKPYLTDISWKSMKIPRLGTLLKHSRLFFLISSL